MIKPSFPVTQIHGPTLPRLSYFKDVSPGLYSSTKGREGSKERGSRGSIAYRNTPVDGAPARRAVLHALLLMELIARFADYLVCARKEHHGHLLGKAHHALPLPFHPS